MSKKNKQKYPRGTRVFITKDLPSSMSHFPKGLEAIVQYTYYQQYGIGGSDPYKNYSLILLNDKGKPYNTSSWYKEDQLILLDGTKEEGLCIIEEYHYGKE